MGIKVTKMNFPDFLSAIFMLCLMYIFFEYSFNRRYLRDNKANAIWTLY